MTLKHDGTEGITMTASPPDAETSAPSRVRASILAGSALAVAIAALWVVLAFVNTGTNYHFAPLVVTLMPTLVTRLRSTTTLQWSRIAVAVMGGVFATVLGALMLLALVAFDGPTLAPWLTPETEAIVMTAIGVGASMLIGRAGRRSAP